MEEKNVLLVGLDWHSTRGRGNLPFAPCPRHLLNEITAATALPLGSISRPLCWQKKQQITFSWIVRLIIISRWQPLHYNEAKQRLTSFHIKIYNANTHRQVFVEVLSALIFWMICQCACWLRCFLTWLELKRGPFDWEWLTFIHTDWGKKLTCNLFYQLLPDRNEWDAL